MQSKTLTSASILLDIYAFKMDMSVLMTNPALEGVSRFSSNQMLSKYKCPSPNTNSYWLLLKKNGMSPSICPA